MCENIVIHGRLDLFIEVRPNLGCMEGKESLLPKSVQFGLVYGIVFMESTLLYALVPSPLGFLPTQAFHSVIRLGHLLIPIMSI